MLVRDIEDNEELTFYLRLPQQWNVAAGCMKDVDTVPAGALPVSADAPISQEMCGKFVGDEVSIETPGGTIHYLILDVRHYSGHLAQQPETTKTKHISIEEHDTYSGRGKPGSGDSQTLDGGRYLGYLARDGNQWGSFPLYDDMSDESDAEGCDYDDRFETDSDD